MAAAGAPPPPSSGPWWLTASEFRPLPPILRTQGLRARRRLQQRWSSSSRGGKVGASAAAGAGASSSSSVVAESSTSSAAALLWKRIVQPLRNFGFGRRTVWEGGVGLFLAAGVAVSIIVASWVKGSKVLSRNRAHPSYQAIIEFANACGITVGTPVRVRGVDVGAVVGVRPSLDRIDVHVEIGDSAVVIPRGSEVVVNQSGLIAETLIDITPCTLPKAVDKIADPLDPACKEEGVIVCDRERIRGEQGVSLDELVSICTKLAHQIDRNGLDNVFKAAQTASEAIESARPLLVQAEAVAAEVAPLLRELRNGELFTRLEALTEVATNAARDIQRLNKAVLTDDNAERLRESVTTLTKTLKHIESISKDMSGVTGDPKTNRHLRQLIQSLSRMVAD
eukprot:jgi/Chlat1/4655/Chrsp3S05600